MLRPPAPPPRGTDCSGEPGKGYPVRDCRVPELGHGSYRHHLTRRVAGLQARDVLWCLPEAAVSLYNHLIRAAEIVEVVDVL